MRKPLLFFTFMLMQAMFLLTAQDTQAQERVTAAQRIPGDSMLYFSIPDVELLEEKWAQSSMAEMVRDPAFADMKKDLVQLVEKYSKMFEAETDLGLSNVLSIPAGEFCIAFVKSDEGKFGGLAFVEYGESGEIVEKILEKTAEGLDKEGAKRSISSVDGTKITIFSFEKEGDDAGPVKVPLSKKFAYFLKDKTFVASNDEKILEGVLAKWDGQAQGTLSAKKEYQYILNKCADADAPAVMHWYMNPVGALQSILGVASRVNPQVGMIQGFLPALGLTQLKAVGGSSYIATKNFDAITKTFTYVEQPTSGIIDIFKCPAIAQQPPVWVSDKVSSYYSINWSIVGAYDSIETLFDGFQGRPGAMAAIIDQMADNPDGPKIHIKKDIIDNLSGRIQIATEIKEGEQIDLTQMSGQFVVALGLKNSDAFQKIIASLTTRDDFPGQAREFQGTTLYQLPAAVLKSPADAAFCIAEDQLFISNDVKQIESILRKDRGVGSLINNPNYKQISENFPEKTSIINYQNADAQLHALYDLVKKSQDDIKLEGIDLSKLPPFSFFQKYLPVTGGYTIPDDQGFFSSNYSMKRAN
ncbi:hypothetical protein Enr10x_18650 [Gimesia panareensis]|uniref:DUF3352 domain-containing protein n=1 Tax=Gimesia panareensis TaxID=2527978 RepID=A0A517Q4M5_9PLAN|nr:hypothetical protein [Gimesia panareensis]QDT26561.1 hypothetical protein Enr10x_18650 [Gimesia panareensis]